MQTFKAKTAERQVLAEHYHRLRFELLSPHRIQFQAGQYVILTIDASRGVRRDYSIASSPSMDHAIDLLIDLKPQGEGCRYLGQLPLGREVEFVGPFGNFVVNGASSPNGQQAAATDQLLFVVTGSGIAPAKNMIEDQLINKQSTQPMRLWWGLRHQEDCFWTQELDELEEEHQNFQWDLALSQPPAGWPLHTGHVTEHVLDYVQNAMKNDGAEMTNGIQHSTFNIQNFACFYLCGNQQMIDEISTTLLTLGINKSQIHFEKFF